MPILSSMLPSLVGRMDYTIVEKLALGDSEFYTILLRMGCTPFRVIQDERDGGRVFAPGYALKAVGRRFNYQPRYAVRTRRGGHVTRVSFGFWDA